MSPSTTRKPLSRAARIAFWAAAALGTVHAAWSFYWALGGTLLLDSVGQWAVDAAEENSLGAAAGLAAIGLLKLGGAWIPLLAEYRRIPWRRVWRTAEWIAGPALVIYGGANFALGSLALLGAFGEEVTNRSALIGHAFIWGPHFALWGAALCIGLFFSRKS